MPKIDFDESDEAGRALKLLSWHCGRLIEHFDSVQIVCTKSHGSNGTAHVTWGMGNWYARFGSVAAWMKHQSESLTDSDHENESD